MTRHLPTVTIALCVAATAFFSGCQRPMGTASGPYAPAGSLAPASSQPLVPFGSLNGATRVPPPPTGSTQVSNGYDGQPAAMSSALPGGPPATGLAAHAPLQSSASGARNALGGMPVIDLTAAMPNANPQPAIYAAAAQPGHPNVAGDPNVAVGSGVAVPGQQVPYGNGSVAASDFASRLRPLDPAQAAAIMPLPVLPNRSVAGGSSVAMTQYRNEASNSPAWQAVQPAVAQLPTAAGGFEQQTRPAAYESMAPMHSLPSTAPVQTHVSSPVQAPAPSPAPSDSLLWRNPAVAR